MTRHESGVIFRWLTESRYYIRKRVIWVNALVIDVVIELVIRKTPPWSAKAFDERFKTRPPSSACFELAGSGIFASSIRRRLSIVDFTISVLLLLERGQPLFKFRYFENFHIGLDQSRHLDRLTGRY